MELRKRPPSKKAPALAALTLAGAAAIAVMKRDRILEAVGRGSGSNGTASGASQTAAEGELQQVTRLPKPGIG